MLGLSIGNTSVKTGTLTIILRNKILFELNKSGCYARHNLNFKSICPAVSKGVKP
jgi:hypothetical protein